MHTLPRSRLTQSSNPRSLLATTLGLQDPSSEKLAVLFLAHSLLGRGFRHREDRDYQSPIWTTHQCKTALLPGEPADLFCNTQGEPRLACLLQQTISGVVLPLPGRDTGMAGPGSHSSTPQHQTHRLLLGSHGNDRHLGSCVILSITVTDTWEKGLRRKDLFRLTVSRVSVHHQLPPLFLICDEVDLSW